MLSLLAYGVVKKLEISREIVERLSRLYVRLSSWLTHDVIFKKLQQLYRNFVIYFQNQCCFRTLNNIVTTTIQRVNIISKPMSNVDTTL